MGVPLEDVLNIIIRQYVVMGSMSFKDREKLKRLFLKYTT